MALELTAESIDRDILTELQAAGANGVLAQALAAFIHHTAERRDRDGDDLRAERDRIREELSMRPGHCRTAGMAADLLVGIERLIEFAIAVEVLTSEAGESLRARSVAAIGRAAERQHHHQADAEPTERFRVLLTSAITSGAAHLANPQGGEPENPVACGWRLLGDERRPHGRRVGWESDGQIYLDLDAALAAVADLERGSSPIAVGGATLRKRLHEGGHLQTTELGVAKP